MEATATRTATGSASRTPAKTVNGPKKVTKQQRPAPIQWEAANTVNQAPDVSERVIQQIVMSLTTLNPSLVLLLLATNHKTTQSSIPVPQVTTYS
jgi:hypothetical protein